MLTTLNSFYANSSTLRRKSRSLCARREEVTSNPLPSNTNQKLWGMFQKMHPFIVNEHLIMFVCVGGAQDAPPPLEEAVHLKRAGKPLWREKQYSKGSLVSFRSVFWDSLVTTVLQMWAILGGRWHNSRRFPSASPLLPGQIQPTESTYLRTLQGSCHPSTSHSSPTPVLSQRPHPWSVWILLGLQGFTQRPRPPWNRPQTADGLRPLLPAAHRTLLVDSLTLLGGLFACLHSSGAVQRGCFRTARARGAGGTWGFPGST